jgi:hypothetical protein
MLTQPLPGDCLPQECRSLAELVQRVVEEQTGVLRTENLTLLSTPGRHGGIPVGDSTLRATVEVGEDGSLAWELTRPTRFFPEYPRFRETALDPRTYLEEHTGPAEEVVAAAKMGTVVFHDGATMHACACSVIPPPVRLNRCACASDLTRGCVIFM